MKVKSEMLNMDLGAAKHPTFNHLQWKVMDISKAAARAGFYYNVNSGEKMPLADNSVDNFYGSMIAEHIEMKYVLFVYQEIYRALKPNGRLRLVVPDIEIGMRWYLNKDLRSLTRSHSPSPSEYHPPTILGHLLSWFVSFNPKGGPDRAGHNMAYDFETMKWYLDKAKFRNIQRMKFGESSEPFKNKDIPGYAFYALYVEAQK